MGDAPKNPKGLESAVAELAAITGQHPVVTRAKKAIANFNLREGMPVGCSVTLRAARMFEFLDRFITIAVPRMRDFRGLPTDSFDGRGNYTIGIKEQRSEEHTSELQSHSDLVCRLLLEKKKKKEKKKVQEHKEHAPRRFRISLREHDEAA